MISFERSCRNSYRCPTSLAIRDPSIDKTEIATRLPRIDNLFSLRPTNGTVVRIFTHWLPPRSEYNLRRFVSKDVSVIAHTHTYTIAAFARLS